MEGGLSNTNSLTAVTGDFKGVKDIALKLKSNILSGGTFYKFKLTVTDISGVESSAIYEIRMNNVPTKGKNKTIVILRGVCNDFNDEFHDTRL